MHSIPARHTFHPCALVACLLLPLTHRHTRFFSIVGIVMTAAPVLDLFFGRFIRTYLLALARVAYASLRPTLTWMVTDLPITAHKWGIIEASAYLT